MSKYCPNCGHQNRDVAIFCGNCGKRLIGSSFSSNLRDTGSATSGSSTSENANGASSGSDDFFSVCCGALIILFIVALIMSMG